LARQLIGDRPLTKSERQQRWREKRRQQAIALPRPEAPELAPVPTTPELSPVALESISAPPTVPTPTEPQEPTTAGIRMVSPDDPGQCMLCLRRRHHVQILFKFWRRDTLIVCNECVKEMDQLADETIARSDPRFVVTPAPPAVP
jgi:hypothetical protein